MVDISIFYDNTIYDIFMDRLASLDDISFDDNLLIYARVISIYDLIDTQVFIEGDFFFCHCSSIYPQERKECQDTKNRKKKLR